MAAPIASFVQLPSDTANAGKEVRTQTRVVGANTVHEHFMIPAVSQEITGKYYYSLGTHTVLATTQNGTATGFYWFQMPIAATVTSMITRIMCDANAGSALATPTAPVIAFVKFTFTGTASGAQNTPTPQKIAAPVNQMTVRTAVTGMTVTLLNPFGHFCVPSAETGVGLFYAQKEILTYNPQAFNRGFTLEIAPGEGFAVIQTVAGTAADTRNFGLQVEWTEIDLT
jgi:hypothetical protein